MWNPEKSKLTYRPVGDLEFFNKEKLPQTPITAAALSKLESWGVSRTRIRELQDFCSAFRYDGCQERVERLSKHPFIITEKDSQPAVEVPFFFDIHGRLNGQCGDLGQQFLIQAEFSGLIERLNDTPNLRKKHAIEVGFYSGLSKTHFCRDGCKHVWNGLVLMDNNFNAVDTVLIDVAFQSIQTYGESGYTLKGGQFGSTTIESKSIHHTTQIGWSRIIGTTWTGTIPETLVLGSSDDKEYVYSLSFSENKSPNISARSLDSKMMIVLSRLLPGGDANYFTLHPEYEDVLLISDSSIRLTEAEEIEIRSLLTACKQFTYCPNVNPARANEDFSHTISW
jgi:hypothetical protein